MPATCGVAMDVPENRAPWVPEPISVDWTATPGATMSGFSALFRSCGPADEKLANALKPGFAIVVAANVPVPPSAATSVGPSARRTPRNGIVTVKGMPVRSEEHTSELQSLTNLVCRLLLEKKKNTACDDTRRAGQGGQGGGSRPKGDVDGGTARSTGSGGRADTRGNRGACLCRV